ncbi:hypothetical protein TNCV_4042431 [Trichonephila clavipes]|nr:hypothetical protein TNCV_4042431 [Trichonephila clavipes]
MWVSHSVANHDPKKNGIDGLIQNGTHALHGNPTMTGVRDDMPPIHGIRDDSVGQRETTGSNTQHGQTLAVEKTWAFSWWKWASIAVHTGGVHETLWVKK